MDSNHRSLARKRPVFVAEGEIAVTERGSQKVCFVCGTDSSNPSPSSSESRTKSSGVPREEEWIHFAGPSSGQSNRRGHALHPARTARSRAENTRAESRGSWATKIKSRERSLAGEGRGIRTLGPPQNALRDAGFDLSGSSAVARDSNPPLRARRGFESVPLPHLFSQVSCVAPVE
jgi:hypothetical protein